MDEQYILDQLGLTEADLKDLVEKHQRFLASLNPAQQKAVAAAMPTAEDAAKTLSGDVTADDLTKFVGSRGSKTQPSTSLLFFLASQKK